MGGMEAMGSGLTWLHLRIFAVDMAEQYGHVSDENEKETSREGSDVRQWTREGMAGCSSAM